MKRLAEFQRRYPSLTIGLVTLAEAGEFFFAAVGFVAVFRWLW